MADQINVVGVAISVSKNYIWQMATLLMASISKERQRLRRLHIVTEESGD